MAGHKFQGLIDRPEERVGMKYMRNRRRFALLVGDDAGER